MAWRTALLLVPAIVPRLGPTAPARGGPPGCQLPEAERGRYAVRERVCLWGWGKGAQQIRVSLSVPDTRFVGRRLTATVDSQPPAVGVPHAVG